ncbi:MAG: hypothetical protein V1921_02585 [Candidatus Altiarchaeota archaeon]
MAKIKVADISDDQIPVLKEQLLRKLHSENAKVYLRDGDELKEISVKKLGDLSGKGRRLEVSEVKRADVPPQRKKKFLSSELGQSDAYAITSEGVVGLSISPPKKPDVIPYHKRKISYREVHKMLKSMDPAEKATLIGSKALTDEERNILSLRFKEGHGDKRIRELTDTSIKEIVRVESRAFEKLGLMPSGEEVDYYRSLLEQMPGDKFDNFLADCFRRGVPKSDSDILRLRFGARSITRAQAASKLGLAQGTLDGRETKAIKNVLKNSDLREHIENSIPGPGARIKLQMPSVEDTRKILRLISSTDRERILSQSTAYPSDPKERELLSAYFDQEDDSTVAELSERFGVGKNRPITLSAAVIEGLRGNLHVIRELNGFRQRIENPEITNEAVRWVLRSTSDEKFNEIMSGLPKTGNRDRDIEIMRLHFREAYSCPDINRMKEYDSHVSEKAVTNSIERLRKRPHAVSELLAESGRLKSIPKVSAETVREVLSHVPQADLGWFISKVPRNNPLTSEKSDIGSERDRETMRRHLTGGVELKQLADEFKRGKQTIVDAISGAYKRLSEQPLVAEKVNGYLVEWGEIQPVSPKEFREILASQPAETRGKLFDTLYRQPDWERNKQIAMLYFDALDADPTMSQRSLRKKVADEHQKFGLGTKGVDAVIEKQICERLSREPEALRLVDDIRRPVRLEAARSLSKKHGGIGNVPVEDLNKNSLTIRGILKDVVNQMGGGIDESAIKSYGARDILKTLAERLGITGVEMLSDDDIKSILH